MKEIVERITADPRYKKNIEYGRPRSGHPEGKVKSHIAELEINLEKLNPRLPTPEYYWKLKFLIHVHDSFKAESKRNVSALNPRSHASLAKTFASEFTEDKDLLNIIQFHDQSYVLWKQFKSRGSYNQQDFQNLLEAIKDWDLFLLFIIIDGSTQGKEISKLFWFIDEARKYKKTFVDHSWVLHRSNATTVEQNEITQQGKNNPIYSYPAHTLAGLFRDVVLLQPRVFREDARACVSRLTPPLQVICPENIPASGGYVITINHYYRPGFAAQWVALTISSVVPSNIHWIITGELTFPGKWCAPLGMKVSRFILKRGAHVYGFTAMPPMPPRACDVEARAAAVRAVLDYAKQTKNPIIGLAPEGGDQAGGKLTMPAPGAGRFGLLLATQGLRFLPVGVYESNGELCIHFGKIYDPAIANNLSSDEKDKQAAHLMMEHIAALLPSSLRGEFA
jgi:hypothetical protein